MKEKTSLPAFDRESISVSVETLAQESYPDLIKLRQPGQAFHPAAGEERAITVSYRDLIVLTSLQGIKLGPVATSLDQQLGGALSTTMEDCDFQSRQGETLVVNLEAQGLGSGNARRILLLGLGDPANCEQLTYCGLAGSLIKEAEALDAEQVLLPLADTLREADSVSMQRFGAVLGCRIKQQLSNQVEHGRLRKIRLVVDSPMKAALEAGLKPQDSLCSICSDPCL